MTEYDPIIQRMSMSVFELYGYSESIKVMDYLLEVAKGNPPLDNFVDLCRDTWEEYEKGS